MKKLGLPLILILVVAALVGLFVWGNRAQSPSSNTGLLGTQYPNLGQKHIQNVTDAHDPYNSNPPTSGTHYFKPDPWGVYTEEVPDEILVHNLEHGGIDITYQPSLPADQIKQLQDLYTSLPQSTTFNEVKLIVAPRAKNDSPISLTAWTYLYNLNGFDQAKILQFYTDHLDKGPELIP
jgi:hypothetical protein